MVLGFLFMSAVCFLFIIELYKSSDKRQIECAVEVLKRHNVTDESFESVGIFLGDNKKCERFIRNNLNDMFEETRRRLNDGIEQRKVTGCVMSRLRNDDHYQQSSLLIGVVEHSKVSWKFWKYFVRSNRLDRVKDEVAAIEHETLKMCTMSLNEISIYDDDEDNIGSGSGDAPDIVTSKNIIEDLSFYFE